MKDDDIRYDIQPIRDLDLLMDMCEVLKLENERDYVLFMTGIYTGLRISDILPLKVRDVKNKKYIKLREDKTNKFKQIEINAALKKVFKDYCKDKKDHEVLFKSRVGINQHIKRNRAYIILRNLGSIFGFDTIGTHTMRKTFGYHYYKKTKDIGFLMRIFNHSSPKVTLEYIGVTQQAIDEAYKNFSYF